MCEEKQTADALRAETERLQREIDRDYMLLGKKVSELSESGAKEINGKVDRLVDLKNRLAQLEKQNEEV